MLLCMGPFLWAQQAMSLEDAQNYAFKNSYLIKNSRHEIEKAEKRIWEITAIGLPQASASLNYQYSPDLPEQPVPAEFFGGEPGTFQTVAFGVSNSSVATFQINQLVFDGTYLLARQGSILLKKIRNDELTKSTIDVRDEVARAYYNVQLSAEAEKILQSNLDNLSEESAGSPRIVRRRLPRRRTGRPATRVPGQRNLSGAGERSPNGQSGHGFFPVHHWYADGFGRTTESGTGGALLQNASGQWVSDQTFRLEEHIEYQLAKNQETERPFRSKGKCGTLHPRSMAFSPTSRAISTTTVSICSITIPIGSHRL